MQRCIDYQTVKKAELPVQWTTVLYQPFQNDLSMPINKQRPVSTDNTNMIYVPIRIHHPIIPWDMGLCIHSSSSPQLNKELRKKAFGHSVLNKFCSFPKYIILMNWFLLPLFLGGQRLHSYKKLCWSMKSRYQPLL